MCWLVQSWAYVLCAQFCDLLFWYTIAATSGFMVVENMMCWTFTAAKCTRALTELQNEREESSKDVDPVKVEALKTTITGWFKWNEKWLNLLSQLRGCAKTPIVHVICNVADVTDAVCEAECSDSNEHLIATTLLEGQSLHRLLTISVYGKNWRHWQWMELVGPTSRGLIRRRMAVRLTLPWSDSVKEIQHRWLIRPGLITRSQKHIQWWTAKLQFPKVCWSPSVCIQQDSWCWSQWGYSQDKACTGLPSCWYWWRSWHSIRNRFCVG